LPTLSQLFSPALLQTLETSIDALDLHKGKALNGVPGRVFPGEMLADLLTTSGIRRDMREPVENVVDSISQYLTAKGLNAQIFAFTNAGGNDGHWTVRGEALQVFSAFISTVYADAACDGDPGKTANAPRHSTPAGARHFQASSQSVSSLFQAGVYPGAGRQSHSALLVFLRRRRVALPARTRSAHVDLDEWHVGTHPTFRHEHGAVCGQIA
jgi:hypothetical protein